MRRRIGTGLIFWFATIGGSLPSDSAAQVVALNPDQSIEKTRAAWIPYLLSTESLGTTLGIATYSAGRSQPQASWFATVFGTSNESALVSAGWNDVHLGESRLFLDAFVLADHFTDQRFYAGYDPASGRPRAGSNDSDLEDYLTGISNELTLSLQLKYRMSFGAGVENPVAIYRLRAGLLESGPPGGEAWNPRSSGQTTFSARYFYTYRDLSDFVVNLSEVPASEELLTSRTNGLELWLEYDNTDFPRNPSRGSREWLKARQDFGWLGSAESWTVLQADASKYFDLGSSSWSPGSSRAQSLDLSLSFMEGRARGPTHPS